MTEHLLVERLDHHYGSAQSLRAVSLALQSGQCLALLGRNGAGKTTLLRCLVGLLSPSDGRILLEGEDIRRWPPYRRARGGIGYVPQGRDIFPGLTTAENLAVSRKAHGIRDSSATEEVCALFPALRAVWRRRGGDLSGGQQQQLAIGRALVGQPRLLILDEPTEGIQPSIVQAIEAVIVALKTRMTILLVEQYVDFARSLADRIAVLSRGGVVSNSAAADIDPVLLRRSLSI